MWHHENEMMRGGILAFPTESQEFKAKMQKDLVDMLVGWMKVYFLQQCTGS